MILIFCTHPKWFILYTGHSQKLMGVISKMGVVSAKMGVAIEKWVWSAPKFFSHAQVHGVGPYLSFEKVGNYADDYSYDHKQVFLAS